MKINKKIKWSKQFYIIEDYTSLFFFAGNRENYYAYEQTVQAFLLIALFLFLAAIVLLVLEVIGKKLNLPIERLGENLIHLTSLFFKQLFQISIVFTFFISKDLRLYNLSLKY